MKRDIVFAVLCGSSMGALIGIGALLSTRQAVECQCLQKSEINNPELYQCSYYDGGLTTIQRLPFSKGQNSHAAIYKYRRDEKLGATASITTCTELSDRKMLVVSKLGARRVDEVLPMCGAIMRVSHISRNSSRGDGQPVSVEEGGRNPGQLTCTVVSDCFSQDETPIDRLAVPVDGQIECIAFHRNSRGLSQVECIRIKCSRANRAGNKLSLEVASVDYVERIPYGGRQLKWDRKKKISATEGETFAVDTPRYREELSSPEQVLDCPVAFRIDAVVPPEARCRIVGWVVLTPEFRLDNSE